MPPLLPPRAGDFTARHRNALLVEAEDAIKRGRYIIKRHVPVAAAAKPAAARAPRADPPEAKQPSLGPARPSHNVLTQVAIDRGAGLAQWPLYDQVLEMPEAERLTLPTCSAYERPGSVGLIGDFPELDIRVLWERMSPRTGAVIGFAPYWGERPVGTSVAMMIDMRVAEPLVLIAHRWSDLYEPGWQRLPVHRQVDGRVRFECPVLGKRCDILYLRDGNFASREAQRLVHRSQRGERRRAAREHSA